MKTLEEITAQINADVLTPPTPTHEATVIPVSGWPDVRIMSPGTDPGVKYYVQMRITDAVCPIALRRDEALRIAAALIYHSQFTNHG